MIPGRSPPGGRARTDHTVTTDPAGTGELAPAPIAVSDDALDDLRDRLRRTRWPERETVDDWSQGIPLDYVQALCATWRDDYDWRRVESELNRYQQLRFTGHGPTGEELGIQVLHAPSPEPDAHPGRAHARLARLGRRVPRRDRTAHATHAPTAATPPTPSTWSARRCPATGSAASRPSGLDRRAHRRRVGSADDDSRLRPLRGARRRLGRGGHRCLGAQHPERLLGIHLNLVTVGPGKDPDELTEAEQAAMASLAQPPGMGHPGTPSNRRPDRKRSAMASSTHRRLRRRGSSRSSGRGATMTATPKG